MKDIIQEYKNAYQDLYEEEPKITRRSSWFYINDDLTGRRKSELKFMAEELRQRKKGGVNGLLEKDEVPEESFVYEHPFMKQGKYLGDGVYLYICQKCSSSVALQDIICEFTYCPSCGYAGAMPLQNCYDCGAEPGEPHSKGCNVERCSVCGRQRRTCNCEGHDPQFARWTGFFPGEAEAKLIGVDLNEFYENYSKAFFVKPTSMPKVLIRIPNNKGRKRTLPREPEPMNENKPHLKLDFKTKLDERLMDN